jgi:MinD superfamily P-loop ATPase
MDAVVDFVVALDEGRCDGCRACLRTCVQRALIWVAFEEPILIDPWACNGCGTCTTHCPQHALSLALRAP